MAPNSSMSSSCKVLLNGGLSGLGFGASGLVLKLAMRDPAAVADAREQAVVGLLFLALLAGEAMVMYALLLSKRVVPATSPALARKLFWIPLVPFLVALAVEAPLLVRATGSVLLHVEIVGNGGAVAGPRGGDVAGVLAVDDGVDGQEL